MYNVNCSYSEYLRQVPETSFNVKYTDCYRLFVRKMLNQNGEHTLMGAIMPPNTAHTNGVLGIACQNERILILLAGLFASLPYDFFIKTIGKSNFVNETAEQLPILDSANTRLIINRVLLLNALTENYIALWENNFDIIYTHDGWSKIDSRLQARTFEKLSNKWTVETPLRTDFERRQALVEIDTLSAMSLGMTLEELKTIYRIQFPILQNNEADTWYDANGRIVFTNNRSLTGIGFSREEFENIKDAVPGKKFSRTFTDDTMPGGPIERTIEYVAPFDRCDREKDYEIAWKFFEDKYGSNVEA